MREKDRIERILVKLRLVWKFYPDWRLGQLYYNLMGHHKDHFYTEDDLLEQGLDMIIEEEGLK